MCVSVKERERGGRKSKGVRKERECVREIEREESVEKRRERARE